MKKRTGIAIIGAGIIGASIAYNLAHREMGSEVMILDRSKAGSGSTSAALGGFRHQFSSELSVKLSLRSISIISRFKELTGYDPLVKHDGYVFVASSEHSFDQLKRNRDLQRNLGVETELLSEKELESNYPFYDFDGFIGGTICKEDGHASTSAVHQGFLSKARESGVDLEESNEVVEIKALGNEYELLTTKGRVFAEKVVIAAGAYSGLVGRSASINIPIQPYPRKILVTKSFTDGIPPEIPLIIDVDSTFAFGREGSGLIFSDNRKVSPSFDLIFPPDYDEEIIRVAMKRVPATQNSTISYAISGLYEMTPDANPIVCEIPGKKGLYCCAGFAGHGFMHSPAIGEIMAQLLLGEQPDINISSLDISRFQDQSLEKEKLII